MSQENQNTESTTPENDGVETGEDPTAITVDELATAGTEVAQEGELPTGDSSDSDGTGSAGDAAEGPTPEDGESSSEEWATPLDGAVDDAPRKSRKGLIVGITIGVLALGGASGYLGYTAYDNANHTVTPSAAKHIAYDASPEQTCQSFKDARLDCAVVWSVDDNAERGNLVGQDVPAGDRVKVDSKVTLTYANGPAKSEFPNLNNVTLDEAKAKLYALNITIQEVKQVDGSSLPEGKVVSTSVEPGTVVENGSTVVLNVSSGQVTVPDWTGKTREFVQTDAEKLGITVSFTEEESDKASGIVIAQTPAAGEASSASDVKVVLSKAFQSKDVTVPDVIGKTAEQAQTDLAVAGFRHIKTVEVTNSEVTSTQVTQVVPGVGQTGKSEENAVLIVSKPKA